jgi:hypothetical protein
MLDLTHIKSRLEWLKNKPTEYKYEYAVDPITNYHVGPDCIRCGSKDCHPYYKGYCSDQCAETASDEEDMAELVEEIEQLRLEQNKLRQALSELLIAWDEYPIRDPNGDSPEDKMDIAALKAMRVWNPWEKDKNAKS